MDRATQVALIRRLLGFLDAATTEMAEATYVNRVSTYTSAAQLERERSVLFRAAPLLLGLSGDAPEPGAYFVHEETGVPILVVRARSGALNAFVAVCRHRGAQMASGAGRGAGRFACPYHGWVYDEDGHVVFQPCAEAFAGLDAAGRRPAPATWPRPAPARPPPVRPTAPAGRHGLRRWQCLHHRRVSGWRLRRHAGLRGLPRQLQLLQGPDRARHAELRARAGPPARRRVRERAVRREEAEAHLSAVGPRQRAGRRGHASRELPDQAPRRAAGARPPDERRHRERARDAARRHGEGGPPARADREGPERIPAGPESVEPQRRPLQVLQGAGHPRHAQVPTRRADRRVGSVHEPAEAARREGDQARARR